MKLPPAISGAVLTMMNPAYMTRQVHEPAEETLQKHSHDLEERVKELDCMYGISNLIETPNITLEEIIQGITELIPISWQYFEITQAKITFGEKYFQTGGILLYSEDWNRVSNGFD